MLEHRKTARNFLKYATLREYEQVIKQARLNKKQLKILELKLFRNQQNFQIANYLHCSTENIQNDLKEIYEAVNRALKATR